MAVLALRKKKERKKERKERKRNEETLVLDIHSLTQPNTALHSLKQQP